jgi:hypothetical protein
VILAAFGALVWVATWWNCAGSNAVLLMSKTSAGSISKMTILLFVPASFW